MESMNSVGSDLCSQNLVSEPITVGQIGSPKGGTSASEIGKHLIDSSKVRQQNPQPSRVSDQNGNVPLNERSTNATNPKKKQIVNFCIIAWEVIKDKFIVIARTILAPFFSLGLPWELRTSKERKLKAIVDEQFYVESCGINDSKRVLSWLESLAPDRQEEVIQYIGNEKPHRMTRIFAEIHPTDEATQKQFFNIFEKFDLGQQMKILGSSFVRQTEYRLSNKGNWYTAERGRDIMLIPNVMAGNIKEYPNLLKLYLSILSELNESILFKALVKHDGALLRSLTSQISDAEALKGLLLIFNKLDRKNWEDLLKTGGSEMFLKSLAKLSQKLEIWEQVIEILQNELNECDAFALLMAHDGAFLRFLAESVEKTKNLDALKKFFPVIDEIEDNDKLHLPALLTANNEAFLISLAKFSADTDVRAQILKIFGQLDRIDATNLLSALKNRGFFMSLARLSQSSDDFRKIFEILESGSRDIYWWQYIMLEEDGKFLEILANSTEDPVVWADLLKSSIERVAHSGILLEANGGALRKIISRHIEGNSAIWCEILKMLERLSWREYGLETIKKILSLRNENGMPLKDHMLAHVPNEELLARLNKIILLINA